MIELFPTISEAVLTHNAEHHSYLAPNVIGRRISRDRCIYNWIWKRLVDFTHQLEESL